MADDPNRARNIERVRRAKGRQKGRRKVGRQALKPTRPNLGRRVGPPASRPEGGRRVGPPTGRRELQPIAAPTAQRDIRELAAAKASKRQGSGPTASRKSVSSRARATLEASRPPVPRPPGLAKKAAGVQSARSFAPGTLAKRTSSGTPSRGKPSRDQMRGVLPEPASLIERIKAQGGKRGSGAPPRRSGKPSRSQFDRMVGR